MGLRKWVRRGGGSGTFELACWFCSSRHGRSRPLQLLRLYRLYRRKWCLWCALGDWLSAAGEGGWKGWDCLWHSWRFLQVCTWTRTRVKFTEVVVWMRAHHEVVVEGDGGVHGESESEWQGICKDNCEQIREQVATTMGDVDETAKLWKVNRTIHELVRDRVRPSLSLISTLNLLSSRASQSQTRKSIWISNAFAISTPTTLELSSTSLSLGFTPFLFH